MTFLFPLTHVLTDNGSCFTPAFAKACAALGGQLSPHQTRTPQTNGMVERFNGRIGSEVLGINIYSHRAFEQVLRGYNVAYNGRRQRVLAGKTPNQVVQERLASGVLDEYPKPNTQAGFYDTPKARLIVESAKEVS